ARVGIFCPRATNATEQGKEIPTLASLLRDDNPYLNRIVLRCGFDIGFSTQPRGTGRLFSLILNTFAWKP
ncbi:MAG: hypothetical protein ABI969_01435, partial [bacterium]